MQLKSLGNLNIAKDIIMTNADDFYKISDAVKGLNKEYTINALAYSTLSEQQKIKILLNNGLSASEAKLAVSTLATDAANKKTTMSTVSLTAVMNGLKTAVLTNPLLMAGVVVAGLVATVKVIDALTTSFKEQQEIVENLTNKISDLQKEYDNLKTDPSANGDRLAYLKRQIELQEDLLAIEKERLALKDIEENMPDVTKETGTSGGTVNPTYTAKDTAFTDIENDLQKLNEARDKLLEYESSGKNTPIVTLWSQSETKALESLKEHSKTIKEQYAEIAESKARLEQYIEDGTLKGVNADDARKRIQQYQDELDKLDPLVLQVDLALGNVNYLEGYNYLLEQIKNSTDVREGTVIAGMKGEDISKFITKHQELNTSLKDGEIAATEWFDSVSNLVTDSGLERAMQNVEDWSTSATDALEEMVATLSTELAQGLTESTGKFLRGESSVSTYIDELSAGTAAQMKMLKSLNKLEVGEDGFVDVTEDTSDAVKEAADSYNELADSQKELEDVKGLAEILANDIDFFDDYQSWTEDMLDTTNFQNYINELADGISTFLQSQPEMIESFASMLQQTTGETVDVAKLQTENASAYISSLVRNNLAATQGMVTWTMDAVGSTVGNASQAIGDVLSALGKAISSFEYSIEAKPYINGKIGGKLFDIDKQGNYKLNMLPSFGIDFKGKGGKSVEGLSSALSNAGSYFRESGNQQLYDALTNIDSYGQKDATKSGGTSKTRSPITNSTGKKSGGSKGSGGGSSKDPYVADIDKYKDLTDAVDEVESKIKQLNQVYDHTDSLAGQIALKDKLIGLYKEEQDALTALNNARDKEISQKVKELRAVGFKIEYDPKTDNLKIKNREHLNSLSQDTIQKYEKLLKATEDLNDANKDSAEKWTELTYAIADVGKEITELRIKQYDEFVRDKEHLLDLLGNRKDTIGMDLSVYDDLMKGALRTWYDLIKNGYEANKEQIQKLEKAWMDYYDARIKREQEILEKQLDDHDRALDAVLDFIDDQLDGLDDQIDALKKINEERREALELQKAQIALDKARNQKTRKVLRKGKGYVYEADEDAIREAEENIAEKQYDASVKQLEKQKENLEELKKVWSEIPDLFEKYQNELLASQILGADWEQKILDGREDAYRDFKDAYFDLQEDIQNKSDELENHMNQSYINMVEIFRKMAALYGSMNNLASGRSWYVNKDGKAPSQAQKGDIIYTKGGTYQITGKDENGKFTSTKLDDKSTDIKDGMWGTLVSDSNAQLGKAIGSYTLSNQNIVDTANKQIDTMYENITGMDVVSKYLANNTFFTQEEINTLAKQMGITDLNTGAVNLNVDTTDANTDSQDKNTDSLNNATDAIDNLSVAVTNMAYAQAEANAYNENNNMKEGVSNEKWLKYWDDVLNFSDRTGLLTQEEVNNALAQRNRYQELVNQEKAIQDMVNGVTSSTIKVDLSDEDKEIIRSLQDAYNTAKAAGNEQGMELAHQLAEAVRNGFDISPIASKPDYKLSDTTYTGGASASTGKKSNLQKDYEWQLNKAKEFGASKDYISRLENAVARETWGSGSKIDTYTDEFGRKSTIINAADPSELKMSEDELKNRYDAGWRPVNDGMDKLGGNLNVTNDTLSDNSDIVSENTDSNYDVSSSIKDGAKTVKESFDDFIKAANSIGVGGYQDSGGSGGKKGSSITDSAEYKQYQYAYNLAKSQGNEIAAQIAKDNMDRLTSSSKSGSGGGRKITGGGTDVTGWKAETIRQTTSKSGNTTWTTTKFTDPKTGKTVTTTTADDNKKKKAKGGRNLVEDIYNVDEYGKKELIIQPTTGRYVHLSNGSDVIPADVTKNLWDFGENPTQYMGSMIKSLNYKLNNGGETINHYNIDKLELPNVVDGKEFWENMTQNLPNEAAQWAHTSTRYRV